MNQDPTTPRSQTGKTDEQVEQELETAIGVEDDTPLDTNRFWDWLIAGAVVVILIGIYFWTRK